MGASSGIRKKNKKRPFDEDPPIRRRSKRTPIRTDFYHDNVTEEGKFTAPNMETQGTLTMIERGKDREERRMEDKGIKIWKSHLKPVGWTPIRKMSMTSKYGWQIVAPSVKERKYILGVDAFDSYEAICEQFEKDGETVEHIVARAAGSAFRAVEPPSNTIKQEEGVETAHDGNIESTPNANSDMGPTFKSGGNSESEATCTESLRVTTKQEEGDDGISDDSPPLKRPRLSIEERLERLERFHEQQVRNRLQILERDIGLSGEGNTISARLEALEAACGGEEELKRYVKTEE